MASYRYCSHQFCSSIIVGSAGDVCDFCAEVDSDPTCKCCDACDYDGSPTLLGEHGDPEDPDQ